MATTARKRMKQTRIAGTEPPSVPEIDEAALAYVDARDERMARLKDEVALQDRLLALMHEHKLRAYEFEGKSVTLVPGGEKVKVGRAKGAEVNGDE